MSLNIYQEKLNIQNAIQRYMGDMIMTKCNQTNPTNPTGSSQSKSYSLYYAKIGCLLCIEDRFIIVIVDSDPYPIGHQEYLSQLNWISFQSRIIEKPPMALKAQNLKSTINNEISDKIELIEKKEDRCVYLSQNYPIQIELLFTEDNDNYANSGTIQSAIDTYNCVITFNI